MFKEDQYFGEFGGRYVPEALSSALDELDCAYRRLKDDKNFNNELECELNNYVGRPSPLYFADNLTRSSGGSKIYLKLESHNHTGAHKINNAVGQALVARELGKKVLIAETGAGQHGLATATVAARFGMGCKVFMGEVDMRRQYPNVYLMRLLGADVIPVPHGTRTLKDAINATLKYWIENIEDSHYLLGSALGPHPYPAMVRDFQSVIGREVRAQMTEREGRLPDTLVACVGGGSNALGLFHPFMDQDNIRMVGVEAGGRGDGPGEHATRIAVSQPKQGIVHGYLSYFLQDENGQLLPTHSVSAGLDYAGIGPEHAWLYKEGRTEYVSVRDDEAVKAYKILARSEGIIPALESSHAVAFALKEAPKHHDDHIMVVNISGRGDKDIFITAALTDKDNWKNFLKKEAVDE